MHLAGAFLLSLLAHDDGVSSSHVVVSGRTVTWTIDVGIDGLKNVIQFPVPPNELTEDDLLEVKKNIALYLLYCTGLEANGRKLEAKEGALTPVYEPLPFTQTMYISRLRQEFRFEAPEDVQSLKLRIHFFADRRLDHRALVSVTWSGKTKEFHAIGPGVLDLTYESVAPNPWKRFGQFLLWGMHHIFIGYDHIAFLLALLIAARGLLEIVKIVTSFTVAHSITLFLSAIDVIRLDSRLTEVLIAASIVYVAVENFFVKEGKHRWILTYCFGLVHGLGFSNMLKELLADKSSVLVPVLSFNLGVELGQIAILLVAFPLCRAVRGWKADPVQPNPRQKWLVWVGSSAVLLFGLGWLVERLFKQEFMPL